MSYSLIPPEIRVKFLATSTPFELVQLRLVSRQFKADIELAGAFRRKLRIVSKYDQHNTKSNSLKVASGAGRTELAPLSDHHRRKHFLLSIFPNITHATVDLDSLSGQLYGGFNALLLLKSWSSRLIYLRIDMGCFRFHQKGKCSKLVRVIISMRDNLKKLQLTCLSGVTLPRPFLARMTNLQSLVLASDANLTSTLVGVSPTLRRLTIGKLPNEIRSSNAPMAKLAASLTHLKLLCEVGRVFLRNLHRFNQLIHLDLGSGSRFWHFRFDDLMTTLVQLPQLTKLSLNLATYLNWAFITSRGQPDKPPYSFPTNRFIRYLHLVGFGDEVCDDAKYHPLVFAFPAVTKVVVETNNVFRDGRVDQRPLGTIVRQHFGQEIEVKVIERIAEEVVEDAAAAKKEDDVISISEDDDEDDDVDEDDSDHTDCSIYYSDDSTTEEEEEDVQDDDDDAAVDSAVDEEADKDSDLDPDVIVISDDDDDEEEPHQDAVLENPDVVEEQNEEQPEVILISDAEDDAFSDGYNADCELL